MYTRLLKLPQNYSKSFFLFGPRGTGKTHWVRHYVPDATYIDLLDSEVFMRLTANPGEITKMIPPESRGWVIIDEVQKIPDLLNEVHRFIENRKLKFILTGSSARSLRKKGVNLLAGRALEYHMHPLTYQELQADYRLSKILQFGSLPSVFSEENPKKYLRAYVNTYLKEEVQQEGLTRNIGSFNRFLETASFSQGSTINISEIARDCHVDRKVAENYFSILEDLLIAARLPVFSKRAKRRMTTRRKFYFFDVGVFRALRPTGPFDSPEEIDGAALETAFFQEVRALLDYIDSEYELFFWRDATGLEVDFVLYGPNGLLAFEIKRSKSIRGRDLRGINAFKSDYPMAHCYIAYGGNKVEYHEGVTAMPFMEIIQKLPDLLKP